MSEKINYGSFVFNFIMFELIWIQNSKNNKWRSWLVIQSASVLADHVFSHILFQRIALGLNETMLIILEHNIILESFRWRDYYNGLIVLTVIPCLQYTTLNNSFKMLMQSNFMFVQMTIEFHQSRARNSLWKLDL